MRKIIESPKLEVFLILVYVITIIIGNFVMGFSTIPLRTSLLSIMLLYFLRMITAFSNWKFSRGISVISCLLNCSLMISAEAIGIYFYGKIGYDQLMTVVNVSAEVFGLIIVIIFFSRYDKRKTYWQYLNINFIKAVTGIIICTILKFL